MPPSLENKSLLHPSPSTFTGCLNTVKYFKIMLGQDQVFLLGGEVGGDTKPICRIQVDVPLHLLVSSVYYPSVDLSFISGFFFPSLHITLI